MPRASRPASTPQRPGSPAGRPRLGTLELGVALALILGIAVATRLAWLCDDAFISFRYADNLVHGLGLVYNAGERVEGYSNFLWTLGIALGMRLGVGPEVWSVVWGVAFYAATIALLCALPRLTTPGARAPLALPLAGLLAAAHRDWSLYATSGLETSCFTFLVTLGYALAAAHSTPAWTSGLVVALAALTRPDGIVFVPIFMLYMVLARPLRVRSGLEFAGAFLALWLPYLIWKLRYYGDLFPNTYYAKSAALAWWSQGWIYVRLYFEKYWALALAIPLGLAAWISQRAAGSSSVVRSGAGRPDAIPVRSGGGALPGTVALAGALAIGFTLYVMRVGGDFMYARFLIPATPFYLLVLEWAVARLLAGRPWIELTANAGLVAGLALTPYPFSGWQAGVVNERDFYKPEVVEIRRGQAATLRRYFAEVPVRIAIVGGQAMLAYYARPEVAIEAVTGLTDRWIAHQPLAQRGRVGHEKLAPVSYLLSRRVDFVFQHASETLELENSVPLVPIYFDRVPGYMVRWNPPLLAEMAKRGARFVDFAAALDERRPTYDRLPADSLRIVYAKLKTFYFDSVPDSTRESWFKR